MLTPKIQHRLQRKKRIRARVSGTAARPRLTVYRSLTQISVQVIDDAAGKTLAAASTKELKSKPNKEGAAKLGALIAKKAKDAGITTVVFDRNGYIFHGCVREVAEAARKAELKF